MLNRSQGCIAWMLIFVLSISCEREPQKNTEIIREVPTTEQKNSLELNLSARLQNYDLRLLVAQDKGAARSLQAAELYIRKIMRTSPTSCLQKLQGDRKTLSCMIGKGTDCPPGPLLTLALYSSPELDREIESV